MALPILIKTAYIERPSSPSFKMRAQIGRRGIVTRLKSLMTLSHLVAFSAIQIEGMGNIAILYIKC
jgi:hypothetical protein